ncbi:uncharacterized protein C8R40DRAFT_1070389 [Lentinula edodes]|uniref:uncharacterized protein n=1 Tax=Lentinula edodes TaxID=5353 RepID=UPI001E8EE6B0|nr:uncharacterized protein C8R40DRAFT_1070389 [Lentinula edodes]KAH7874247.1 hypothetical protein C8R40DRAFT_1070389 [Lentinula edodes]
MTDYTWSTLALTGFNFTYTDATTSISPLIYRGYQSASFQLSRPNPSFCPRVLFDLQVSVSIAEVFTKPELLVQVSSVIFLVQGSHLMHMVAQGLPLLERWRVQQVWAHEYTMHGIYTVDLADTRPLPESERYRKDIPARGAGRKDALGQARPWHLGVPITHKCSIDSWDQT